MGPIGKDKAVRRVERLRLRFDVFPVKPAGRYRARRDICPRKALLRLWLIFASVRLTMQDFTHPTVHRRTSFNLLPNRVSSSSASLAAGPARARRTVYGADGFFIIGLDFLCQFFRFRVELGAGHNAVDQLEPLKLLWRLSSARSRGFPAPGPALSFSARSVNLPRPGIIPNPGSGSPKRASSEARRISQQRDISMPEPST